MPDGSTFNEIANVLPGSYLKTLKVGDVLNNDEQNPLIYKKLIPQLKFYCPRWGSEDISWEDFLPKVNHS